MDETENAPRWDGVERRKQPAVRARTAGGSLRRIAEATLANAGGNLLSSGLHVLTLYLLTR